MIDKRLLTLPLRVCVRVRLLLAVVGGELQVTAMPDSSAPDHRMLEWMERTEHDLEGHEALVAAALAEVGCWCVCTCLGRLGPTMSD